jgi:Na+/proline symporter
MMAAFAGPLMVGALWKGVTRAGAYAGLLGGISVFITLHAQLLSPDWFNNPTMRAIVSWLYAEGPNPYSCAVMGEIVSIGFTVLVSKLSQPLPSEHLDEMFSAT